MNIRMAASLVAMLVLYFWTDSKLWSLVTLVVVYLVFPWLQRPREMAAYRRTRTKLRQHLRAPSVTAQPNESAEVSRVSPAQLDESWRLQPRSIRVFVSSTFADLQEERAALAQVAFPQIRRLCAERGVTFSAVDLRWGVTTQEKDARQVVRLCLSEVERSRPHFVGILAGRYGWIAPITDQDATAFPWLRETTGASLTELEIRHGALNPGLTDSAFFYFVDNGETASEGLESYSRLASLKAEIRNSGATLTRTSAPRELASALVADFRRLLDRDFPATQVRHELLEELAAHALVERTTSEVYVADAAEDDMLGKVLDVDSHLLVTGPAGSGKTALLAHWVAQVREARLDRTLVVRYVGATPSSTSWRQLVESVMDELAVRSGRRIPVPENPSGLTFALAEQLRVAAPVLLVLDGLDGLEDLGAGRLLTWLPDDPPAGVTIVVSARDTMGLTKFEDGQWSQYEVAPLRPEQAEQVVTNLVALRARRLDHGLVRVICHAEQAGNPRFLAILVEELQAVGRHEDLASRVSACLTAQGPFELLRLALLRMAAELDPDDTGLLRRTCSLIWAARRGLSESELRDLLGVEGLPLPSAIWSPVVVALEPHLVAHDGVLTFAHEMVRAVVERLWLSTDGAMHEARTTLADYFESPEMRKTERSLQELTEVLYQAKAWGRMARLFSDPDYLGWAFVEAESTIRAYWAALERDGGVNPIDLYADVIAAPRTTPVRALWAVASLLDSLGYAEPARRLFGPVAEREIAEGGTRVAPALHNLGVSQLRAGRLPEATTTLLRALDRGLDTPGFDTAETLNLLGICYQKRGDSARATEVFGDAIRMADAAHDDSAKANALNSLAVVARQRMPAQAETIIREQISLATANGDLANLALGAGTLGTLRLDQKHAVEALALFEQQEHLCTVVGDAGNLQTSLRNQVMALRMLGRHVEADEVDRRAARLRERGASTGDRRPGRP